MCLSFAPNDDSQLDRELKDDVIKGIQRKLAKSEGASMAVQFKLRLLEYDDRARKHIAEIESLLAAMGASAHRQKVEDRALIARQNDEVQSKAKEFQEWLVNERLGLKPRRPKSTR
jgi:hypothetical protein